MRAKGELDFGFARNGNISESGECHADHQWSKMPIAEERSVETILFRMLLRSI